MAQWKDVKPNVVRLLMERYGSATAVATALGVHKSRVSRWLSNDEGPGIDVLQRIAKACPEAGEIIRGMF